MKKKDTLNQQEKQTQKQEKEEKEGGGEEEENNTANMMEELIRDSGGCGCFQITLAFILKFGMLPIGWSMMQMSFAGKVPDWWCSPGALHDNLTYWTNQSYGSTGNHDNLTAWTNQSYGSTGNHDNLTSWTNQSYLGHGNASSEAYQSCNLPAGDGGQSCMGYVVFDHSIQTVINEWGLICDLAYVKGLMTSLQMGGVLVGAFISGQLSDTLGRKVTVYFTLLAHTVTSLVAAFSVTWQMFITMRVLIGVTLGMYLVGAFSYPLEFLGPKHRQIVAFIPAFTIGIAIFALVAYITPNWRHLHIGAALLGAPVLPTWFVVPESARWLATKNRLKEAEHVIGRVARMNGRKPPPKTKHVLQQVALAEQRSRQGQGQGHGEVQGEGQKEGGGRSYTYLDVYRGWRMALTTLAFHVIWFVMSFSYYGISFGVTALSGNLYLNIFLMGVIEIPTNFLSVLMSDRIGRRWTTIIFTITCALCSFGMLIVTKTVPKDDRGLASTVLAMGSKLSVGSAWFAAFVFTSEQYPTVIRNLGFAASNTVSRIGGALAPLLIQMDTEEDLVLCYTVIGSLMLTSALCALVPRETKGQDLQDTIAVAGDKVKVKANDAGWGEGEREGEGHGQSVRMGVIKSVSEDVDKAESEWQCEKV